MAPPASERSSPVEIDVDRHRDHRVPVTVARKLPQRRRAGRPIRCHVDTAGQPDRRVIGSEHIDTVHQDARLPGTRPATRPRRISTSWRVTCRSGISAAEVSRRSPARCQFGQLSKYNNVTITFAAVSVALTRPADTFGQPTTPVTRLRPSSTTHVNTDRSATARTANGEPSEQATRPTAPGVPPISGYEAHLGYPLATKATTT